MSFSLTDDGTLDTVIRCDECGEELRFNFDPGPDETDGDEAYEAFVESCIENCEADHDCDQEALGPQEDDIATEDHIRFYQSGYCVLECDPATERYTYRRNRTTPWIELGTFSDYRFALKAYMAASQYWPNCWFISDHGNAHLMTLDQTESQS